MNNEAQAQPKTADQNTYNHKANFQAWPRSDLIFLGYVSDKKSAKDQSESANNIQSPFERAFGPDTWSQWTLAMFALAAAVFGFMAFRAARRQADIASQQFALDTSPSIYVDRVGSSGLSEGQKPVFFVMISNTGRADALNVTAGITVKLGGNSISLKNPMVFRVPAKDDRYCFIFPDFTLAQSDVEGINNGTIPLQVSGRFTYEGKDTEYCYKYNPWPGVGERPFEFPSFVPCDLTLARAITFKIDTGHFKVT